MWRRTCWCWRRRYGPPLASCERSYQLRACWYETRLQEVRLACLALTQRTTRARPAVCHQEIRRRSRRTRKVRSRLPTPCWKWQSRVIAARPGMQRQGVSHWEVIVEYPGPDRCRPRARNQYATSGKTRQQPPRPVARWRLQQVAGGTVESTTPDGDGRGRRPRSTISPRRPPRPVRRQPLHLPSTCSSRKAPLSQALGPPL